MLGQICPGEETEPVGLQSPWVTLPGEETEPVGLQSPGVTLPCEETEPVGLQSPGVTLPGKETEPVGLESPRGHSALCLSMLLHPYWPYLNLEHPFLSSLACSPLVHRNSV